MSRQAARSAAAPHAALPEVDSLQRGLDILRCFRNGDKSLRLADMVERTKIPRPSAQKLLNTLTAHRFLRYLPELDRYEPDVACFVLGHALVASLPVLRVARPVMQALAEKFGVDVFLAKREGMEMMILENCSTRSEPAQFNVGYLVPLAQTAVGRAWLWGQKPTVQGEYIERIRAHADPDAINAVAGIYRAFQDLAERGYCVSLGEWLRDRHAMATPLVIGGGSEVLALAAAAGDQGFNDAALREAVGGALVDAAARIRNELPRSDYG